MSLFWKIFVTVLVIFVCAGLAMAFATSARIGMELTGTVLILAGLIGGFIDSFKRDKERRDNNGP